jgi:putative transposase
MEPANTHERYRFDYRGMHRYLIRLPVHAHQRIFLEREPVLTILDILRAMCWKYHFDVYAYCFLPDQLVLIVRGKKDFSDMKTFLSAFRSTSSDALRSRLGHALWQRKYLERVLRKKEDSRQRAREIFELPVTAGLVKSAAEYPFQGSFVLATPHRAE